MIMLFYILIQHIFFVSRRFVYLSWKKQYWFPLMKLDLVKLTISYHKIIEYLHQLEMHQLFMLSIFLDRSISIIKASTFFLYLVHNILYIIHYIIYLWQTIQETVLQILKTILQYQYTIYKRRTIINIIIFILTKLRYLLSTIHIFS